MYEGKLAMFEGHDDTDYEEMRINCPYCSGESTDEDDCNCENYTDVICFITPLTLRQRIRARLHHKFFEMCVGTGWSFVNGKKRAWVYRPLRLRYLYYFLKKPTIQGFKQVITGKLVKKSG
jgi:hypothetical protein